jgi:hypothetical protein
MKPYGSRPSPHRDHRHPTSERKPHLLISPIAFMEAFRHQRSERIHAEQRALDLILPSLSRLDVFVRHKCGDAEDG